MEFIISSKGNMMEEICDMDNCGFPTSECMISDHPKYCGQHLEEWFLDHCERIEHEAIQSEQMFHGDHPDPVGV